MPLYEYTCKKCGENFTLMLSLSEKESAKCPRCDSSELQQKYGAHFLGSSSRDSCQTPPRSGFS